MTDDTAAPRPIRVMLVEDSPTELYLLKRLIMAAPDMEIAAVARNGRDALEILPRVQPDVVCTDYRMPVMDGLEFIGRAIASWPCPILVLSVAVQSFDTDNIFRLLTAGAVDVMAKPIGHSVSIGAQEGGLLLEKIRAIANSPAVRRKLATHPGAPKSAPARPAPRSEPSPAATPRRGPVGIVAIGASTGGPQILQTILSQLRRGTGAPIVCVQHISEDFLDGMISWLATSCELPIEIPRVGSAPQPGRVYFAPDGCHLLLDGNRRFLRVPAEDRDLHCPSVDRLLSSVAAVYGENALGVLLSGMGRDGAWGLKAMNDAGATTIAQDEHSSMIFGMPAAAIEIGAASHVLGIDDIAATIRRLTMP